MLRSLEGAGCFNRPFDNQASLVVHMESIAKLYIQSKILLGDYGFIWSDILEFENSSFKPY